MGNNLSVDICCNEPPRQTQPPTMENISTDMMLMYDNQNQMMRSSYDVISQHGISIFQKACYNWHSIPITTQITLQRPKHFQVKNIRINNDHFVAGIIKQRAIFSNTIIRYPWMTDNCICYQSHRNHQSFIVHNSQTKSIGIRGVRQQQILTVLITNTSIAFKVGNQILGRFILPLSFRNEPILPYVALFDEGDQIQFISAIQRQRVR